MIFSHHAIPPISKNKLYSVGKFKVFLLKSCGRLFFYETESDILAGLGKLESLEQHFQQDGTVSRSPRTRAGERNPRTNSSVPGSSVTNHYPIGKTNW